MSESRRIHAGGESGGLQEELKQSRPFSTPQQEAILAILRTADVVKSRLNEVMDAEGVTFQQYNVLRILRGSHPDPLPTLEIGERLIERMPGITRLLDRLEDKGLVTRQRCTHDRRQVHCWITEAGLDVLRRLDGPVLDTDALILGELSDAEVDELIRVLERIRRS
jgi:MarR family transcriptional regulator, 2-MHQ and catechol-resistance regulon repressor